MSESISIALALCNGARHLPALLDSLAEQQLRPDELVASDDASDDDSIPLLETFAATAPFPVRLLRQPQRLGVTENFSRTIAACRGDIIALCDQDDVWHPDKLAKLVKALRPTAVQAAFSDAKVVDASLRPLGYTMWQRVRFTAREQTRFAQGEGFAVLLKHRIVTGATLAFKVSLRDMALPIPAGWPHDAWLAVMAAAHGPVVALAEPLIDYRQHGDNVVGAARKSLLHEIRAALALDRTAWYRDELAQWRSLAARLGEHVASPLREKIHHLETRAAMPTQRWRRVPGIAREMLSGRYARYARNWGSIAIDLLVR